MGDQRPNAEVEMESNLDEKPAIVAAENEILLISSDAEEKLGVQVTGPDENVESTVPVPRDSFRIVYLIFIIHGIGILMPWNMFINATSYFTEYKLNPVPTNGTEVDTSTAIYRTYFLSCLGFVSQIPNVLFNGINLFCQCKSGSLAIRIVSGIIVVIVMFILTIVLAMVDSSSWPAEFFWITMATVVVINIASGIYQNSIFGTAACLPSNYMNAVIIGSNISGLVTSIIALIAAAATPDPRTSAIYYFLTAIFILLVAFDTYFALPMFSFYRYHFSKSSQCHHGSDSDDVSHLTKYIIVIKKCWVQLLSVFLVFFITLTCFPAIEAGIESSDDNFPVKGDFFRLVTCFLFFNLFAVVGSFLAEFVKVPGPKFIWLPVVLRVLFIPFFMLCNFHPKQRSLPVVFGNDYVYSAGSILLALTSGYFSSLAMTYAPSNVENKYKSIAGMMAGFCLILGVFCGVVFSAPVIYMIEHAGPTNTSAPLL